MQALGALRPLLSVAEQLTLFVDRMIDHYRCTTILAAHNGAAFLGCSAM